MPSESEFRFGAGAGAAVARALSLGGREDRIMFASGITSYVHLKNAVPQCGTRREAGRAIALDVRAGGCSGGGERGPGSGHDAARAAVTVSC